MARGGQCAAKRSTSSQRQKAAKVNQTVIRWGSVWPLWCFKHSASLIGLLEPCTNVAFVLSLVRFTMLSTPLKLVVPTSWASRLTSGCGYWNFKTWTGTVTGGSGRQTATEATCLPTTSASQNTHEQTRHRGRKCTFDEGAICKQMEQMSAGTHCDAPGLPLLLGLIVRRSDFAADSSHQT